MGPGLEPSPTDRPEFCKDGMTEDCQWDGLPAFQRSQLWPLLQSSQEHQAGEEVPSWKTVGCLVLNIILNQHL